MRKENKDRYVLKYRRRDDRLSDLSHYLEQHHRERGLYPSGDVLDALGMTPVTDDGCDFVKYRDISLFMEDMDNINTLNLVKDDEEGDIVFECMQCWYRAKNADISDWQFCPACGAIFAPYYIDSDSFCGQGEQDE